MTGVIDTLHEFMAALSSVSITILEIIGIVMIIYGALEALWLFYRSGFNFRDRDIVINLGEALSLSLQFNLGAEIIKTIMVRDVSELVVLVAVVIIRIVITLLIHWEIEAASKSLDTRANIAERSREGIRQNESDDE